MQILTDLQNSLTGRLLSKFSVKWLLKITLHLKYVTAVPCKIFLLKNRQVQDLSKPLYETQSLRTQNQK